MVHEITFSQLTLSQGYSDFWYAEIESGADFSRASLISEVTENMIPVVSCQPEE